MTRASALTIAGLLRRMIGSATGPGILIAVITLAAVIVGVTGPVAVTAGYTAGVRAELDEQTTPLQRDLVAQTLGSPDTGASADASASGFSENVDQVWGKQNDVLTALHTAMPEPLAGALDEQESVASMEPTPLEHPEGSLWPKADLALTADPRFAERIHVDAGTLPAAATEISIDADTAPSVEMVLATSAATSLGWQIGEVRTLVYEAGEKQPVRLSGTFAPVDAQANTWAHEPLALRPTLDFGSGEPNYTAQGYVDAGSWPTISRLPSATRSQVWFPLDPDALTDANAQAVATQLRSFVSQTRQISSGARPVDDFSETFRQNPPAYDVKFSTRAPDAIGVAVERNAVTSELLAMILAGPTGVLIAVLLLITRLWVSVRRQTFALIAARGASETQLRLVGAVEGAAFAVPAAALGLVGAAGVLSLGWANVGGAAAPDYAAVAAGGLGLAAVFALLPSVLFAASIPGQRAVNGPLDESATSRLPRITVEAAILLLTTTAIVLLRPGAAATTTPGNPLEPVTALLIALTGCVIALRIFPPLMASVARAAARAEGLTAFYGSADSARSRTGRLASLVAITVGLSISLFAISLVGTIATGIRVEADSEVGAGLTVFSRVLTQPEVDTISANSGASAVATVKTDQNAIVSAGSDHVTIPILVVDAATVRQVQADLEAHSVLPPEAGVAADSGASIPVVASTAAANLLADSALTIRDRNVSIVDIAPNDSALTTSQTWILVDQSYASAIAGPATTVTRALFAFDGAGPTPAQIDASRAAADDFATVLVPSEIEQRYESNPTTRLVTSALELTVSVTLALSIAAMLMTFALGTPARRSLLGTFAALGMRSALAGRLVAWEILPISLVAGVVGVVVGTVLPQLILPSTDLRPFTGSTSQPAVVLPIAASGLTLGAFLLATLLTAVFGALVAIRSLRAPISNRKPR